jgi:phenylacetate-CoA ligase
LNLKARYFNQKLETIPRSDLEDLQRRRFKDTIDQGYRNSSLYKKAFDAAGLRPDDISGINALQKIGFFTTKEDLRKSFPFGALAIERGRVAELHATSGTTGTPALGAHSEKDLDDWGEISARSLVMSGLTRDDVFQITPSLGMFSGGFGFYHGARKVGCTIVPASAGFSKRQIQYMVDFNTTMISAIVSYAFRLAEVAKEEGIDPRSQTNVRKGIFGSEMWTRESKKRVASLWDMDPFDVYGFTELYGPGVGNDCFAHDGLHMWEDYFLVEVVDPKTGETLGPEEKGELVFTTLRKEAMPLIRYRSGDRSFLIDSTRCECGRTHRRFGEIVGRTDDMVKISGVNFWPSEIETVILREPLVGEEYKVTVTKNGTLDSVLIEVESKEKIAESDRREALEQKLVSQIKSVTMVSAQVKILEPNSLPRIEIGKKKRIFDERN